MRILVLVLLVACGDNLAGPPDAPPPTCKRVNAEPDRCSAIYGDRFREFRCEVGASVYKPMPGYTNCYLADRLICCQI